MAELLPLPITAGPITSSDLVESRRQTFMKLGEGDILSEFIAKHQAGLEDENSIMTDVPVAQPSFSERFAVTHAPALVSSPSSAASSGSQSARRTTRASVKPTTTTTGRASMKPAVPVNNGSMSARQAKLADWKNTNTAASSSANKENKFASTSVTPSSTSLKRKSVGLSTSSSMNKLSTTNVAGGSLTKKPRISTTVGITSRLAVNVHAPNPNHRPSASPSRSPRKQPVNTGLKRKSMAPETTSPTATSSNHPSIQFEQQLQQLTTEKKAWQVTAQWRMMLLQIQREGLQTVTAQYEQAQQALQSVLEQLNVAKDLGQAAEQKSTELQTQLQASSNSESMLRLAAEELNQKVDELRHTVAQNKSTYEKEVAELKSELSRKMNSADEAAQTNAAQISSLKGDIQTLTVSEASLKQQLAETQKQLAFVNEQRYADEVARKKLHAQIQDLKGSIRIFCRIRPSGVTAMSDELDMEQPCFSRTSGTTDHGVGSALSNFTEDLQVTAPAGEKKLDGSAAKASNYAFNFDKVFMQDSQQVDLFKELDELIVSAMDSTVNVSVFAYGSTGAGKTHTMLGPSSSSALGADAGMIPRAIDRMFTYAKQAAERHWSFTFKAALLEIYNDEIKDLLATRSTPKEPKIQHDKSGKVVVSGLEVFPVTNPEEVHALFERGTSQRSVSSTACNSRSSRSHTVFQFQVDGLNEKTGEKLTSLVNLIDLAGSERLDSSKAGNNPTLLKETQHINSSLSTLVTCMSAVASKSSHVPFRDSKLTHLLQDSLGKNSSGTLSRTLFFIHISPESINFNETLCTLRFAEKLKSVEMNTPSSSSAAAASETQANKRPKRK